MGGRRDDDGPGRSALPAVPPRPPAARPSPTPRPVEQPRAVRPRAVEEPGGPARRVWLAVGLVLAAVATAAVFLTDDPLVLRIVLLAVCWAFVVAAFLGGSRGTDRMAAAAREAELRAAYDLELEREVAARHAHEAELESRLRREAEEAMRGELRQLRTQLGALDRVQEDLAAISRLRGDLEALGQLSAQLADLTALRGELAGVGDLRAELGRLRTEVTEQLSGEVLVERMVMRAQSVRGPAQGGDPFGGRTLAGTPDWTAEPPVRPAGWDVDSWTTTGIEIGATTVDADPAPRPTAPSPPVPTAEPTRTFAVVDEEQVSRHRPPSPVEWLVGESVLEPWTEPSPRSPREWLDEQSLTAAGDPTGELPATDGSDDPTPDTWSPAPPTPRRHRRAAEPDEDDLVSWTDRLRGTASEETPAADAGSPGPSHDSPAYEPPSYGSSSYDPPSYEPPSYGSSSYGSPAHDAPSYDPPSWLDGAASDGGPPTGSSDRTDSARAADEVAPAGGSSAHRAPEPDAPAAPPEPSGHARLEQILAESGVPAPSGARSRRRRHREEGQDDGDDVLARVLGRD